MKQNQVNVVNLGKPGNNAETIEFMKMSGIKIISVVVNSANRSWAKFIDITAEEYRQMIEAMKSPDRDGGKIFALFCDGSFNGKILNSGNGGLTKEEFNKFLKAKYNTMPAFTKNGTPLKNVE